MADIQNDTKRRVQATTELPIPWVVIQLSQQGEQEFSQKLLYHEVRRLVGDCEVFFPWVEARHGYDTPTVLFDGYIFIRDNTERSYRSLSRSSYFEGPIVKSHRTCSEWTRMGHAEVSRMKERLIDMTKCQFDVGECVRVTDGPYVNMEGVVSGVGRQIQITFVLPFGSRTFTHDFESRVLEKIG